jgi:hypothetical protein
MAFGVYVVVALAGVMFVAFSLLSFDSKVK